jgi:hypothetical protein
MPAQRERNPHIIDLDDMLVFIETGALAWQTYAKDGLKRLEYRHAGGYRVTVQGVVTYQGTDGRSAVNAYNAG